ncbi:AMP-binding protein [Novosphingobium sp. G106]|uniref:AMP-binding protein n=1 Tax=Novosphingobium sp. G106 TaxID=2849500 RepID=UPI001C2DEC07|nr:AMP-binding protein [Novosphingobium sp. G106]MBV1686742.1 AMP-binding protein [Novosphingobium sp. G106]
MTQRVRDLLEIYSAPEACAARLLCDHRDPAALAYRIVAADLSVQDVTYGELRRESERFAAVLQALGVGPGDRVATLMGKSRSYLVTLMGIWRLGAVHVPLFTAFAPPAIAFRLNGSGARAVVCDDGQLAKLACEDASWRVITTGEPAGSALSFDALMADAEPGIPAAAAGGDAPLIHIYTSGTTGNPKGVVVPLRAVAAFQTYAEFGLGIRAADDVFWCAADPGWAYGLYFGVLATLSTGVRSLLFEGGFTPESTLAVLAQERVTNFAAAPTVYRALRASGLRPAADVLLRCASSAGEPLTPDVNLWAKDALGVAVHDHYGQTEAGMLINNHHHPAVAEPIKDGAMGRAMPGWTATILHEQRDEEAGAGEVGRVAMVLPESPLAWFQGYDGDPAKSAEKFAGAGRWYVTGDTGRIDADGQFHFSARDDDVIIMAGYRIGPFEVESVLATHPAVAECAVIAVPDEVRGEVIEAYAVLREGHAADAELERDIQQWVKRNYAAHAYPRRVHFTPAMPKTPSGKIQRFVLKQQRLEELARQQGER